VEKILEAGRWAPSAPTPMGFIVIRIYEQSPDSQHHLKSLKRSNVSGLSFSPDISFRYVLQALHEHCRCGTPDLPRFPSWTAWILEEEFSF
jgi:hypothetical protein